MLKLSKQGDYGLILMTTLAVLPSQQYLSLKKISVKHQLPYKFLSQIASKLKLAQLIVSKEGTNGGYRLQRPATSITIKDIIIALDGPIATVDCQKSTPTCRHRSQCLHHHLLAQLTQAATDQLQQSLLSDLVETCHA